MEFRMSTTADGSASAVSRQWQLVRRPSGWPVAEDFRFIEVELPPLGEGEVRVQNEFISVDPYMRGRMNDVKSYIPPFVLGETMIGGAVGRVTESRSELLAVGDLVEHYRGWRDVAQGNATQFQKRREIPGVPVSAYLGVLGVAGLTAWIGLLLIAELKEGETVFISGAAGAVGSVAGQIAKFRGAGRVVGSAGTDEKVELLRSRYGFDAGFNYKNGRISRQLQAAAPDGIDVYFDNVGGEHLEAALFAFRDRGRAAMCGAISVYNNEKMEPGPRNLSMITTKGLTLKGFTITNYQEFAPEFISEVGPWVASGELKFDETVVDGIENALNAFHGLMRGENIGKMLVRIQAPAGAS
jgi:NADPH-dependent curcumin reductase CurA